MGKTIIIKQKQPQDKEAKEKKFCRNCGTRLVTKHIMGMFCSKVCLEEFAMKYKPEPDKKQNFDTDSLPYRSYSTDAIEVENYKNERHNNNEK